MENINTETKKEFSSIEEIIQDENFINFLDKNISEYKRQRDLRPLPKPGFRYKRDWFDRMNELGNFNSEFFIKHIADIWNKKSSLSSEIREVIKFICNRSVNEALNKYNSTVK